MGRGGRAVRDGGLAMYDLRYCNRGGLYLGMDGVWRLRGGVHISSLIYRRLYEYSSRD